MALHASVQRTTPHSAFGEGGNGAETLLFLLLILLHLVPLWAFAYFPSQDGPAHLNNANIIRAYFNPELPLFREYFTLLRSPDPGWFGHLILAGLMGLAPPLVAEKILLSGFVILLPLSVRYAARSLRPDAGFLAVLAFPFVYGYPLHMGFYYFCFSLVLFFVMVGYWLRHRERFGRRGIAVFAALWLLLYFTHIVTLVMAWLAIGILAAWLTLRDLLRQARRREWNTAALRKAVQSRALIPLLAFLPTLVLILAFLGEKGTTRRRYETMEERWDRLRSLDSLVSFRQAEAWLSTALVWVFLAALVYLLFTRVQRGEVQGGDGLILVALGFLVLYFLTPDGMSGGAYISQRLVLFPFFALILWFAAQRWHRGARWGVQFAAAGISIAMLGLHLQTYTQLNRYLHEYMAGAERVEPNTTLLSLSFAHWGDTLEPELGRTRIGVFRHAAGHLGAQRNAVVFPNYEANSEHFPVRYRPGVNPHTHISTRAAGIELQPPAVDFLTYPERTGGRVDYVLLWGVREGVEHHEEVRSIFAQLEAGYELIDTSPRGLMQLYRSRESRRNREVAADP